MVDVTYQYKTKELHKKLIEEYKWLLTTAPDQLVALKILNELDNDKLITLCTNYKQRKVSKNRQRGS